MEEFSEKQKKQIQHYVTNTGGNVFALKNLPEVIKGALFSRYSRSSLGLRSLLLKEFIQNDETEFTSISGVTSEDKETQSLAIKKAQNFYDRILDGYGDDSIGELGGAHLAVENLSMIAAKELEDCRIGGSPLEKSTRYIYFDQKVDGEYLFYREPNLMTSAYRDTYLEMCNALFEVYGKLIPPMTELMEKKFPKEEDVSNVAYTAALRAKVLDCLRGLLPAGTLTNIGVFGNGRFFETMIQKLHSHNLCEIQDIGKGSYDELSKVIPSFVRRAEPSHKHYKSFSSYREKQLGELKEYASQLSLDRSGEESVKLVCHDPDGAKKVAAGLMFAQTGAPLHLLQDHCRSLPQEELERILDLGATFRENRRHKSPRALEHASFTFEIISDFGAYRDLQRHRTLTQEKQLLTCDHGYYVPNEIIDTPMEKEYREVLDRSKEVYDSIAGELPEEAQYCVPMAYNIRWYFHVNLRALQWMCELRSSPAGHPTYRYLAQEMAKQVSTTIPEFERFFTFVDYEGYELGRLGAEIRTVEKLQSRE